MLNPLELIQLQITLEYALDELGLLVPFPGSSEQGLYIVYHHSGGYVPYFNQQLPARLRTRLREAGGETAFSAPDQIEAILREFADCHFEGKFVSEYILTPPDRGDFVQAVLQDGQWVILVEDSPACWAWSERSNEKCAEVAVETLPEQRRKGYARQVVAAWADEVIRSGRTAFYSYKADNLLSRALARSLGAVWYADVVGFG